MKRIRRLARLGSTITTYTYYRVKGKHEQANQKLLTGFTSLGGLYVKFLQLLVLRDDINTPGHTYLRDALAVFDDVAVESIDIQRVVHAQNLSGKVTLLSDEPFATGSFAQVYKGVLNDGSEVAVKVLRPSVVDTVKFDLWLLSLAARFIAVSSQGSFVNSKHMFDELKSMTLAEIDYKKEAQNAWSMYTHHKQHKTLVIPKTYLDLCSSNVIVQDLVSGVSLTELMAVEQEERDKLLRSYNIDLDYILEELAFESLNANFNDAAYHGDPHPGNIILLGNNKAALIDFGIQGKNIVRKKQLLRLMKEYVDVYGGQFNPRSFTKYMLAFYVPDLMKALSIVAETTEEDILQRFDDAIGDAVERILSVEDTSKDAEVFLRKYQLSSLFAKVINKQNRFAVEADLESLAFVRSTLIFLNVLARLRVDISVVRNAYLRVIAEQESRFAGQQHDVSAQSLDDSLHYISNWLERVRYSDPVTYQKLQKVFS